MTPPPLRLADWDAVHDLVDRFEFAWTGAVAADLAEFLPPANDPLRVAALDELVKTDLEIRWRRGLALPLEQYLERFPELRTGDHLPGLVYEEYRARHLHGDRPPLAEYRQRFPEHVGELERLLQQQPVPSHATPRPQETAVGPLARVSPDGNDVLPFGGGFRLLEPLGHGGSAEVWRAEGPSGFEVAVKVFMRPIDNKEAQRELQALELIKRLRHPFLLQTQAYWQLADRLYIVMELADGSLHDRLRECRHAGLSGIPVGELLTYFHEAAEALDYLHSEQVLHRDVKPDNILLLKRHAKVADFGLASLLQGQQAGATSGSGTPAYMAPEVFLLGHMNPRSDQYSLAVTYAELRRGQPLFSGQELYEVMRQHLQAEPDLDPLPEAEQRVLRRALHKTPAERFPSCREFGQALEKALGKGPAAATAPRRVRPRFRAGWFWFGFVVTVLGVLLVPLLGQLRPPGPASEGMRAAVAQGDGPEEPPTAATPEPEKPPPPVVMPAGVVPASQSRLVELDGRFYYDQVSVPAPSDGTPVPFVLVPKTRADDPETFYMMRDKVSVGLFGKFAAAHPDRVHRDEWRKGVWRGGEYLDYPSPECPVLRVPADVAAAFADWLGGRLPTPAQWDKAAGRFEPEPLPGPYATPEAGKRPDVAVGRLPSPWPVGKASDDHSPYLCRDMAGNGQEWTRPPEGGAGPVPLRGQRYDAPRPLLFQDLERAPTQSPQVPSPYIGFRVVLEP